MVQQVAVVTGAGSGIGRAVAIELSQDGLTVIGVGRRLDALRETASLASGMVVCVSADVGTTSGRDAIADEIPDGAQVRYLVHAAGIFPKSRVSDLTLEDWQHVMATNVEARLFLTQRLIPQLRDGGRVLFVGSRSATTPRQGGLSYCVSQAASFMLHECLKLELAEQRIGVASAVPGPVDTAIVQASMVADPAVFPDRASYAALHQAGELIDPAAVGRFYRWLLTETDETRYRATEWNILDPEHQAFWMGNAGIYSARQ